MRKSQRPGKAYGLEDLAFHPSTPSTAANQEWLKQTASILEMLNEAVAIGDDRGRIRFVNNCMEHLLGMAFPMRQEA